MNSKAKPIAAPNQIFPPGFCDFVCIFFPLSDVMFGLATVTRTVLKWSWNQLSSDHVTLTNVDGQRLIETKLTGEYAGVTEARGLRW